MRYERLMSLLNINHLLSRSFQFSMPNENGDTLYAKNTCLRLYLAWLDHNHISRIVGPAPEGGAVEVTAIPLVGLQRAAGEGVGLIHSALRRADGLPARGGGGQRLPLCKETTDFLLTAEVGQNRSVPQNTPRERKQSE